MILSDMRKGMSEACKYSVGWHALLFPSMRGMGGEQKFLLFVCVCVHPLHVHTRDKKKTDSCESEKHFRITGFQVSIRCADEF